MNLSRRGRWTLIAVVGAIAVIIVVSLLNPTPTSTITSPAPVPSQATTTAPPTPTPTVTDANSDAVRIDGVKARAAMDMAMALVAGTLSLDYQVDPTETIKAIRPYSTVGVQAQVADRLKALNWADLKARKVVRFADVTDVVPYAAGNSQVPQHVDVTVDIYEGQGPRPKKVDTQTWTVAVGSGQGANGWIGTNLTLKPAA